MDKCSIPIDKRQWTPSLVPGPIVLVSTISPDGVPNVAPKSWVQMVAFEPSLLMFSGQRGNPTENNVDATKCFALNVVNEALLPGVVACLQWHGPERIDRASWTLTAASKIAAPLVSESPAHLECTLERSLEIGSAYLVFGRIVQAAIDRRIVEASAEKRYQLLNQVCFLEDGVYAAIRETIRL